MLCLRREEWEEWEEWEKWGATAKDLARGGVSLDEDTNRSTCLYEDDLLHHYVPHYSGTQLGPQPTTAGAHAGARGSTPARNICSSGFIQFAAPEHHSEGKQSGA
jgi:hypothetical protein